MNLVWIFPPATPDAIKKCKNKNNTINCFEVDDWSISDRECIDKKRKAKNEEIGSEDVEGRVWCKR